MSEGQPEVAVLGAGIAGLSIAWQLLRQGVGVSVVSGVEPAASAVAAGMPAPVPQTAGHPAICPAGASPLPPPPPPLSSPAAHTHPPPPLPPPLPPPAAPLLH